MRRTAISVVIAALSLIATASAEPPASATADQGPSVRQFMTPDGRIDINAVRTSGYQGPLDLKGVGARVDPRGGAPLVSASSPQSPADDPDDIYWDNSISPSIPGVDGTIYSMIVYNGRLIVGGSFTIAGSVSASNIASWDGVSWSPLGLGTDGTVRALTAYDGKVVAGGDFISAGGAAANHVAIWDGNQWSTIGDYRSEGVSALAAYEGNLIAAGGASVASWNGTTWSSLGSGTDGVVNALTVYDGRLIAGGSFDTAGGVSANNIASWDGTSWSSLGLGEGFIHGALVSALAVHDQKLVAAGHFWEVDSTIGGWQIQTLIWDGTGWSGLGAWDQGWDPAPEVAATALVADGSTLLMSRRWHNRWGGACEVLAWDGSSWTQVGESFLSDRPPLCGVVFALAVYNGRPIAAGGFSFARVGVAANNVASWDGSSWSPLVSRGSVYALTVYDGRLIAGGQFAAAGGVPANNIAAWDGSSWSALGSGMAGTQGEPILSALTVYEGKLVAGGRFDSAGDVLANNIASWDGSSWSPLGTGTDSAVSALTIYDGKLIAGGYFRSAGGVTTNYTASWNGSNWSPLGLGMDYNVYALTVYDGRLIAGGRFSTAGGDSASAIASWDGTSWSPLGSWMGEGFKGVDYVRALTEYDGKLIAGGGGSGFPGSKWRIIKAWDGTSWSELTSEVTLINTYRALAVYDSKLIIGGGFGEVDEVGSNNISSWDGSNWSPLGSGLNGNVRALTEYDGRLIAGGLFTTAGNKPSVSLAIWTKHNPTDVDEGQTKTLPNAFSLVQNYPNPFNPTTSIEYTVPTRAHVTVEIFNSIGQHVRTLVDEMKSPGKYKAEWDGMDVAGKPVSTGVYLYRFKAGEYTETKKMVLLK